MSSRRNAELAARLADSGLSQEEFAAALNASIGSSTGRPGRVDSRYVRYLLSGYISWPQARHRRAIEAVLRRSALELGFVPRGRRASPRARARPTLAATKSVEGEPVDRRCFLYVIGGMAATITIPGLPASGRIGLSDVTRLRTPLLELAALDDRHGGGLRLAAAAAEQAQRIHAALEVHAASDQVRRRLHSVAGEYLTAAAWYAVDADSADAAGRHLDHALRVAMIAQDPILQAQIWNVMALRSRQLGNQAEAYGIARAAVAGSASRRHPTVAALFHARVAHGHAWRGERGLADRSLGRAADALTRPQRQPGPAWAQFVDAAEIAGLAAHAHNILGSYDFGATCASEAVAATPAAFHRNRVHRLLTAAEANLGRREIERSTALATSALRLTGDVRSGRVRGRFATLRTRFAHWPDVAAAREWIEQYDAQVAPPLYP